MSRADLYPLGLGTFRVVSLRADPPNDDKNESEPEVSYRVGVFRLENEIRLVGIVTVLGEDARGIVVMDGDVVWRDADFDEPVSDMSEDQLAQVVAKSFAVHTLYDSAAMTLRQSFGLLGREQPVQVATPEPDVEILVIPDEPVTSEA
jgi:hypothetical protein